MAECPDAVFAFRGEDEVPRVYLFFGAMVRCVFQDPKSGQSRTNYPDRDGQCQTADAAAVPYPTLWPHLEGKLGPAPLDCYMKPAGSFEVHGLVGSAGNLTRVSWHPERNVEPRRTENVLQQSELATVSGACETEHPDHVLLFGTSAGKPAYWVWKLDEGKAAGPLDLPQGQGEVQAAFRGFDTPEGESSGSGIRITRLYSKAENGFTETAYTIGTTSAGGHTFTRQQGAAQFLTGVEEG
ncbi:hypothetical protein [Nonomuraea sp. NPDC001699]